MRCIFPSRACPWPGWAGRVRVHTGRCARERGLYFAHKQIDARAYSAANVALCRSIRRLAARGLVAFVWSDGGGLRLTDQGRQTAQQLTGTNAG